MREKCLRIAEFINYWMLIAVPFSMAIAPGLCSTVQAFLAVSFFAVKFIKRERLFTRTAIDIPYLALIIISLFSIFNSVDLKASNKGITKLLEHALLYLVVASSIKDMRHMKRLIIAILAGGVLATIDGAWQNAFGKDFIRGNQIVINIGLTRATAALPNPNVLGIYLSPMVALAFGLASTFTKRYKRELMWISVILALGVVMTVARPAALAVLVSVMFLAFMLRMKKVIAGLLILLLLSPFLVPQSIRDWAKCVNYNPIIFMCNPDRISIYRTSINMIRHHPIIGVGVNTYTTNYYYYKVPEAENARTHKWMYAHNNFFHMAGEIGLVGLGVFIWLLFMFFAEIVRVYRKASDARLRALALCFMASIIAFLVNGLTESSLYYARVAPLFWYLVGCALALRRLAAAQERGS